MRTDGRFHLSIAATAALLAACGGSQPPAGLPGAMPHVAQRPLTSGSEKVIHSFKGRPDGATPYAALLNIDGTLYGTTSGGGTGACDSGGGCGTVFKISTSGTETVLHSFRASRDGAHPFAGLIRVKGMLYGTTLEGGAKGYGTVFSMTTSGKETVLHSFGTTDSDGKYPYASLIYVNGMLYGTTASGGTGECERGSAVGCGTVFKVSTSGGETVVHRFGTSRGGVDPQASLISVNRTLYGTTYEGGARKHGTVFSMTRSGKETLLRAFQKHDGWNSEASLINVNGALYGTTTGPWGTVFSITTSGQLTVLHTFSGSDGTFPTAPLLDVDGTLYGTTENGGANDDGTVFSLLASGGNFAVLYTFKGYPGDGSSPRPGLVNVAGTLYGTTVAGGSNGDGTVFALTP